MNLTISLKSFPLSTKRRGLPACPLTDKTDANAMTTKPTHSIRKAPFITIAIFLALALLGISLNEPNRVLEQAWQVCLSCIGIG